MFSFINLQRQQIMTLLYLKTRPMVATVVTAGTVSLLARSLPHQLRLMVAAIAGIAAGLWVEGRQFPRDGGLSRD